ncbi:MAG: tRNA preQ1(34) S-adenosylmethionine ribosyltransferase-isomerase QueA [Paenibacillaceae bacterium]|nr:tRNA preQ1(34) S-adenosylmethionine ribosyltransferase-isomerase QueA [Paenibacillaceae bacterium]
MDIDFFEVPQELIAQTPLAQRDASRLLCVDRVRGTFAHNTFVHLVDVLRAGDLVVVNTSAVIRARVQGRLNDDASRPVALLFVHRVSDDRDAWVMIGKPARRMRINDVIAIGPVGAPVLRVVVERIQDGGERIGRCFGAMSVEDVLRTWGEVPLPPYITTPLTDASRYQTVYAHEAGSVAAPTAGLHMTPELLNALRAKGVRIGCVALHVGIGTFRPVQTSIDDHTMHEEQYIVPAETVDALVDVRSKGGRIVAIGTTVVRTLETIAPMIASGTRGAISGWTPLFIRPGHRFALVDALVTNFHLPRSTLLLLVGAFAGEALIQEAYALAIAQRYRFYSFGDAMLIADETMGSMESE